MNNNIIKMIEELTSLDRKTLTEKALKTAEEVGELARAALPFMGAHGTNHRFMDKRDVLEESADVIICALSTAFEVGASSSDIEEMMKEKSQKWAYLLQREENHLDKTPYEIHITVKTKKLDNFIGACKLLDVKPIILDLQNQQGDTVMKDVMTSSVHLGTNPSAYAEMEKIAGKMAIGGFEVIRKKIETVPWHPAAPQVKGDKMPKNCYLESHFAVICSDDTRDKLQKVAKETDCHLSKNIFKKLDDGKYKIMLTYRKHDSVSGDFEADVKSIKSYLEAAGFQVDKTIIEFSVYDTRVSHDSEWINKGKEECLTS
jgi:NTP pyrophosphatase (non-canonical NTP hydrolase)